MERQMARKIDKTPFQVGDKVRHRFVDTDRVLTVEWVCKGKYDRTEQIISTDLHRGQATDAILYERAE